MNHHAGKNFKLKKIGNDDNWRISKHFCWLETTHKIAVNWHQGIIGEWLDDLFTKTILFIKTIIRCCGHNFYSF